MNLRQFCLVALVAPAGIILGGSAVHFGRDPSLWHLPFAVPAFNWKPSQPTAAAQPAAKPAVASVSLAAAELRNLVGRCRPAGAGELLPPSEFEGGPAGGALQCAASWRGGDPVRVVRVLDQELERLASAHGYRCEAGPSFSGGTSDYSFTHARRSLRSATSTASVDVWVVRGADNALTLIVHVGCPFTPAPTGGGEKGS